MAQQNQVKVAKVLKVTRKTYEVAMDDKIIPCIIRGKLAADNAEHKSVRAGDNVKVEMVSEDQGAIQEILPRKTRLSRIIESRAHKEHIIATNIDQILIITSTKKPAFKSGLLDRYLIIAEKNEIKSKICINKIDLSPKSDFEIYAHEYTKLGYPTFFSSTITKEGIDPLIEELRDNVTLFVGHSGVGKSSIIGAIEPGVDIKVQHVSSKTKKGMHTTSSVELFSLSFGGFAGDTPGIRELGLWDILKKDLKMYYVEFHEYADMCQFADCQHIDEPDCAVKAAVRKGDIFTERYENYLNIYSSLKSAYYE